MATDIYSMLTGGYDPRAEQMKQQQLFQQQLGQATTPQSFIATVGSNMGNMLGQGVQKIAGVKDPREEKDRLKKEAMDEVQASGVNMSDQVAVLKAIMQALQKRGLSAEAMAIGAQMPKADKVPTSTLAKLLAEQKNYEAGTPQYKAYQKAIDKETASAADKEPSVGTKAYLKAIKVYKKPFNSLTMEEQAEVARLVEEDAKEAASRDKVSVTIPPAETEYSKTVAKGAGAKDLSFVSSAQSVAESLPQMYETSNLIATSDDLLTGIGSGVFKDFYRIVDQFTSDKEAGKKVSDTEYLDALMGREVFTQITALGIGARGLDTPAEREFLRSVMTGTTTLNEETLKKLTNLRINVAERAIKKYNKKLASGQLDRYMKASGEKLEPIEIPKRSSEAEITSLISRLKANPQYANLTDKQAERALRKAGKIK
jgi:hypothetical protein